MRVCTTRFGKLQVEANDLVLFPAGLVGMQRCRQWMLLEDVRQGALAWLQSVECGDLAVAVASPRRFLADFQLVLGRRDLAIFGSPRPDDVEVLAIVGRSQESLTLNLKAPLVIDVERRIGCQVINRAERPVRFAIEAPPRDLRTVA